MKTSIRELKAKLSEHIRTAGTGEDVIVSAHGKPVAKIVAPRKSRNLQQLKSESGISWNGGKPRGMLRPKAMKGGQQLSEIVGEERR